MYALADKALAKADQLSHNRSESAGTRAYLGLMRGQWIESETAFRTAIVADPNNPDVRQMYSQLLGAVGHIDAARTQARLAQEIDPLAPVVADRLGILHLWLGRDADAERDSALARELGLDELAYPETKSFISTTMQTRRTTCGLCWAPCIDRMPGSARQSTPIGTQRGGRPQSSCSTGRWQRATSRRELTTA
jgi:Tfp pilus assembly protein PilF